MSQIINQSNAHIEILKTRIAATQSDTPTKTRPIPTEFFDRLVPFLNRISGKKSQSHSFYQKKVEFNDDNTFVITFSRRIK